MKTSGRISLFAVLLFVCCSQMFAGSLGLFPVTPSGDLSGASDWNRIMFAFQQAVSAGPGSVVQFTAGDFYVHKPIQIANFSGTVRGAGKGLTNLHTAPGVPFDFLQPPLEPYSAFLLFYTDTSWPLELEVNITVSGLTVRIEGPSKTWVAHDPSNQNNCSNGIQVKGRVTGLPDFELSRMNVIFEHLEVIGVDAGIQCAETGYTVFSPFVVNGQGVTEVDPSSGLILLRWYKPVTGSLVWRDVYFENSLAGAIVFNAKDSVITFGGSPNKRIVAKNGVDAVAFQDISNSRVEVSYLETYNRSGVDVYQGARALYGNDLGELVPQTMPELSKFIFTYNTIRKPEGSTWGAFELGDIAGEVGLKTIDALISNNDIVSGRPVEPYGPIYSYFLKDAIVTNNRISGSGWAGIYVGPFGTTDTAWTITGNNLQNFNADVARIYLGQGTSKCTIVGASKGDVLDEGVGNIIVGANNKKGNFPNVADAMQRKHDLIKWLRQP